jgi:hypothetical protein
VKQCTREIASRVHLPSAQPITGGLAGPAQPKKIKIIKNNKNCVGINKKYKYKFIIFYSLMPESE